MKFKKTKLVALVLVCLAASFAAWVQYKFLQDGGKVYRSHEFSISADVAKADLNLGKRLYSVREGCIACHGEDLAGSKVVDNPAMGLIYGANISPYNLSHWTDEEIARAIRYGILPDGHSLKFMPSYDYAGVSKGDLAALIAYLRAAPPVAQPSHRNAFGPVTRVISSFGNMPVMFPAKIIDMNAGFSDKPPEGPTAQFGEYLAHSCSGCHGEDFRGGPIPGGDPSWPDAANIRFGTMRFWSEAAFRDAIKTGFSPTTKRLLRDPMPIALLKQMNDVEIKALWAFLSSLH